MGLDWRSVSLPGLFFVCQCALLLTALPPSPTDWDMVFADDEREANPASFKFFQAAQEWQRQRAEMGEDSDSDDSSSDDEDDEEEADGVEVDQADAEA